MNDITTDSSKTIFLASMGRSGSTFISNILNYDGHYRILFEPFRFDMVAEARDFIFPLYLRPDEQNEDYTQAATKILSGEVSSEWVDKENLGRQVQGLPLLIKDIRANFFLKWLHNQFPAMRMILLLRHPCAVASSWLAAGFGDGSRARQVLLANEQFVQDSDARIIDAYRKVQTDFERLIFFWCFSYQVPFRQYAYKDLYVLFYEDMLTIPQQEINRLFTYLKKPYSEDAIMRALARPSSTTARDASEFIPGTVPADRWKQNCTEGQIERAADILQLFGMNHIYDSRSIPNHSEIEDLFLG